MLQPILIDTSVNNNTRSRKLKYKAFFFFILVEIMLRGVFVLQEFLAPPLLLISVLIAVNALFFWMLSQKAAIEDSHNTSL